MRVIIPMSGQGTRYQKAGYSQPKPLIPVNGTPMIERLLRSLPLDWSIDFVLAENHRSTELPVLLKRLRPQGTLHYIAPHSKGPSFALAQVLDQIPRGEPLLVSYCDYGMVWDANQFEQFVRTSDCDACLVSYRGFHAHYLNPVTYAFSRLEGDRVVEVREKGSFTDNRENEFASSGAYFFKSREVLKQAVDYQLQQNLSLNGEYYTSLTVQALLLANPKAHVRVFEIPYFHQWGTPEDLRVFEYWEKTYSAWNREAGREKKVEQILMPMAGLGSRFQNITDKPKPLVSVNRQPMFTQALQSLPKANHTVIVALDTFSQQVKRSCNFNTEIISLEKTPSGQALSTEAGVAKLDLNKEVLVSSCDHGIVLSTELWEKFEKTKWDAAIFTIRGYPGAARTPNSYAYVIPKSEQIEISEVARVSVKVPVSENPQNDSVLVGTFWFRTAEILQTGISELKKKDIRVNGELYLDSIFEILQQLKFRVCRIPLAGYVNWGDPAALSEALYWQENFCGHRVDQRPRLPHGI